MKDNKLNLSNFSDEQLMNLYKQGDFAAFEILYSRHSGRTFEYLKKKVSVEIAKELLQDTFQKVHQSRDKYNSQYPFLPWLFMIARNSLYDFFKKAETQVAKSSDSTGLESLVAVSALGSSDQDLASLLQTVPLQQKRAIELRYLQDWSFEQIAGEMKTSEDNVRKMISRGIQKIRESFDKKKGGAE